MFIRTSIESPMLVSFYALLAKCLRYPNIETGAVLPDYPKIGEHDNLFVFALRVDMLARALDMPAPQLRDAVYSNFLPPILRRPDLDDCLDILIVDVHSCQTFLLHFTRDPCP
jgi:hypothetical protein